MADSQISEFPSVVKASYWFPDGAPKYPADLIDSKLFTHLICAFADLDPHTYEVIISSENESIFSTFTDTVKRKNPEVQTLLSIGGKNIDKSMFPSMASNPISRKAFIDSSIKIARDNKFDGLDLAWEYPSNAEEMLNFGTLLQEWRKAVQAEENNPKLLLTAAVYYSSNYNKSVSYPIGQITNNLDWVHIIAFDFDRPTLSTKTGPSAALFPRPHHDGHSGSHGLNQWKTAGLSLKKAVFGLPYVAWAWTLKNVYDNGYDAPTIGPALTPDGSIKFVEVRKFIADFKATTVYNDTVVEEYCYAGSKWIGYDGTDSITKKVKYANDKGLLGYFAWHVGADDKCDLSRHASEAWKAAEETTAI